MKNIFKERSRGANPALQNSSLNWEKDWQRKLNSAPTTFRKQRRDFFATANTTKARDY